METILSETRARMEKTVEDLTRELSSVRTGRASVHLLDSVRVDYYGSAAPINQVAALHVPEPALLTVQPWDASQIQSIEKAILAANLGLNPSNDGKIIRVPIPSLTEERRQQLARRVGKIAEEHRTAVRNIRRDSNDRLKKMLRDKEISEDMEHQALEKVQEITNEFIRRIDDLATRKEQEIREV